MRYKIDCQQVMSRWYVTVHTYEPDGLKIRHTVGHYQFGDNLEDPWDLWYVLEGLKKAIE